MQRAVERTTCQHSTDRPLDFNWTSAGKMVLRESYPRHWSYRQRRATGSLSTGAQVRALTRNPHATRFPPRVEVVCGDLTLPESLDACLDGINTVS